jgi:hypothetical protein
MRFFSPKDKKPAGVTIRTTFPSSVRIIAEYLLINSHSVINIWHNTVYITKF